MTVNLLTFSKASLYNFSQIGMEENQLVTMKVYSKINSAFMANEFVFVVCNYGNTNKYKK